jgi:PD-(D/E)XK nuclease superfamily protein
MSSGAEFTISAKGLGALAMPDFCPRCFWIESKAEALPFQIPFPGIFNSIDAYEKALVESWFHRHHSAPPWLAGLGKITGSIKPPHYTKFSVRDGQSGIVLRGTPDGILELDDDSYAIFDFKTAKFTAAQDELFPMYEVQLNAYAFIGERSGVSPVSKLALIYAEPVADRGAAQDESNMTPEGFRMGFAAKILGVEIQPQKIRELLQRAARILNLNSPPSGRDGCENCAAVEGLSKLSRF